MISWIVIAILVGAALIALKMNRMRHKVWIILLIFAALFLYTSVALVYKENSLEFNTVKGILSSAKVYVGWLGNSFQNLKTVVGNAIKMDWTSSKNISFFNKTDIAAEKV